MSTSPLYKFLQYNAAQAQDTLAQMQGMTPGAAGNFLYNGKHFKGVFGSSVLTEQPMVHGGYRRRSEVMLTVTRDQTTFTPVVKTLLVRLDTKTEYAIDRIDTHDPIAWNLTLVKTGE